MYAVVVAAAAAAAIIKANEKKQKKKKRNKKKGRIRVCGRGKYREIKRIETVRTGRFVLSISIDIIIINK